MKKVIRRVSSVILIIVLIMSVAIIPCSAASKKGDVNGDGKITAADSRLVLRGAAKLENFSDEQMKTADVNADNKVTAADARKILRVAAKLESESSLSGELPIIPPHFEELNNATFASTFGSEFDYKTDDANYVVFELLTSYTIPLGYLNYFQDTGMTGTYSDPEGKFMYCQKYSIENLKWICEEVYNVDFSSFVAKTSYSYAADGYLYRECCGPTGLEELFYGIIKNYTIDSSGRYNMNFYYVCEHPDGMDILGEYNIVAEWIDENGGYWSFYSIKKI